MDSIFIEILEKGILAGGSGLSKRQLGVEKKKDYPLLDYLVEQEFLEAQEGNRFQISTLGFQTWKEQIPLKEHNKVRRQAISSFLKIVEEKEGRKLSSSETSCLYSLWYKEALEEGYIQEVEPSVLYLNEVGKDFLISSLPFMEQLEIRREYYQKALEDTENRFSDLTQDLKLLESDVGKDYQDLQGIEKDIQATSLRLQKQVEDFTLSYQQTISQIQGSIHFAGAARRFRHQVLEEAEFVSKEVEKKTEQIEKMLSKMEKDSARVVSQIEEKISQSQQKTQQKIAKAEKYFQELVKRLKKEGIDILPSDESCEEEAEAISEKKDNVVDSKTSKETKTKIVEVGNDIKQVEKPEEQEDYETELEEQEDYETELEEQEDYETELEEQNDYETELEEQEDYEAELEEENTGQNEENPEEDIDENEELDEENEEKSSADPEYEEDVESETPSYEDPSYVDENLWEADEAVLEVVARIYKDYCTANPHRTGLMPIPKLYDPLVDKGIVKTLQQFHELLHDWAFEDRLVLHVCSNPEMEPRSEEGIPSEHGLLFYVQMK